VFRWSIAVAACLAVFAGCWWVWEALGLPPSGSGRLGVALAVAAAASAAAGGPLFWWAGRDKPGGGHSGGDVAAPPGPAAQVVVGEIPREPSAFVERQALVRLAEAARPGRAAVVYAVTGLRGVGKTQLAAAYARDRISQGWGWWGG
jgi:hypothetical protein